MSWHLTFRILRSIKTGGGVFIVQRDVLLGLYVYFYLRLCVCITHKATASKSIFVFENSESRGHVMLPKTHAILMVTSEVISSVGSSILSKGRYTVSVKLTHFTV
jgi:hypothetical protein